MNPLVKKLGEKLLPEFEKVAEKIRREIPNVTASVYAHEVGAETQHQGYSFGVECGFLENVPDDEPDNVGLDINLGHLTTVPKISADVGWGYPSGETETAFRDWGGSFPNEGMIVSDEILEDLYKDLPRLYDALFDALRRRKPADE